MFPDFDDIAKKAEEAAKTIVKALEDHTTEQRETNEKLDHIIRLLENLL